MEKDLTKGPVTKNILLFALPLMFDKYSTNVINSNYRFSWYTYTTCLYLS